MLYLFNLFKGLVKSKQRSGNKGGNPFPKFYSERILRYISYLLEYVQREGRNHKIKMK